MQFLKSTKKHSNGSSRTLSAPVSNASRISKLRASQNNSSRSLEKEPGTVVCGYLKSKKKHRINFLAPKWHSKYYILNDDDKEIQQFKDRESATGRPELSVPYSEIESVAQVEHFFSKSRAVFELVMKETASVLPPGSVWSFEAGDELSCVQWVNAIASKTNGDGILLAKEDIKSDFRHFYEPLKTRDDILGTGMTGTVKKVRRYKDGKLFAMKTIRLSHITPNQRRGLQNEIDILKTLDHPHISKLFEVFVEPGHCVRLIMEICNGGELFDRLHKKRRFNEHYTAGLMAKMLSVLNYLHCNKIVHRDLKLENWLFRNKDVDDTEIVLIDFGLSKRHKPGEHMHRTVGTSYYVAPEVLSGDYVGEACDLWSLGVIAYMLMGGTAPFDGADDDEIIANVKKHRKPNMTSRAWERISDQAKDFISQLLEVDTTKRMTAAQGLQHPWITMEEENRPKHEIDSGIIGNLKRFTSCKNLKRIALEVVAFSLDHDEIKNLTMIFEDMDSDRDGYISFHELRGALQEHHSISDSEAQEIFSALDQEHKGKVHVNEFVAAALQEKYFREEEYLADAFYALDRDSSGYITIEDLRKVLGNCATRKEVEQILEEVDEKHRVSYKEFIDFMREDGVQQIKRFRERSPVESS